MIIKSIKKITSRTIHSSKEYFRSYKKLIFSRTFLIFTFLLVLGNIYLHDQYVLDLSSFALNERVYSLSEDVASVNVESAIFDKFFSAPTTYYSGGVTIGLILYTEIFTVILFVFLLRRHYKKRLVLPYLLIIQILSASLILLAYGLAPSSVIDDLNNKANEDIKKQVNLLSSVEGQRQLMIKTTPEEIKSKILLSSNPPMIIDEYTDINAIIYSFKINEKDTLYRAVILPKVISMKEDWGLNYEAYLFPDNILIIKKPSRKLLNLVLPVLSKKIVEKELDKYILDKKTPSFSVLSDDAYDIVQNQKLEKIKDDYISRIAQIKIDLAEADSYIKIIPDTIVALESEKTEYKNRTDKALTDCRAYFGTDGCRNEEEIVNRNMASIDNDLKSATEALQGWKNLRPKIAYILTLTQNSYEGFLQFPIVPEVQAGIFEPPDTIYVKYYPEGENLSTPSDYLHTALHEYLHYLSYNDYDFLPTFINEGFTDYLANKLTTKYSYRRDIPIRYAEEVAIIKKLTKAIPENALLITYFANSEQLFKILINASYPKGTYEELVKNGESLTYLSVEDTKAREQILKETINLLPENSATPSGQKN